MDNSLKRDVAGLRAIQFSDRDIYVTATGEQNQTEGLQRLDE